MIFSELYSAYYNAVAQIIKTAIDHPVKKVELRKEDKQQQHIQNHPLIDSTNFFPKSFIV